MNDLENMSAADAKAWYDTWYVPNNAYVVITGDVDHKEVSPWPRNITARLRGRARAGAQTADRNRRQDGTPGQQSRLRPNCRC